MLSEIPQNKLAKIVPYGMDITEEQRSIRKDIESQKHKLQVLRNFNTDNSQIDLQHKNWSQILNNFFNEYTPIRFGISPIIKKNTYENADIHQDETRLIVFTIPMSFEKMQSVPSLESATEILNSYRKVGNVVVKLTEFLLNQGIKATGHHPLGNLQEYHHLLLPPHAARAGLGEKGRPGLFIDHEFGPMVRIGAVSTSLSLEYNEKVDKGVNAFCHRCRYCVKHCPPRALPADKYLISLQTGIPIQFKIDYNKCISYFEKHFGCGKCIVKCILALSSPSKITKRIERIENWYNKWIVSGELEVLRTTIT